MKPFDMLINQIAKSYGYSYDDAENYAKFLKSSAMVNYYEMEENLNYGNYKLK